jgi:hypothetical protein
LDAWRSGGSTRCLSGGSWSYVTSTTTLCAALAVTKSGGARRDIGSRDYFPSTPASFTNTSTSIPYCPYRFTVFTGNSSCDR